MSIIYAAYMRHSNDGSYVRLKWAPTAEHCIPASTIEKSARANV